MIFSGRRLSLRIHCPEFWAWRNLFHSVDRYNKRRSGSGQMTALSRPAGTNGIPMDIRRHVCAEPNPFAERTIDALCFTLR